jgi:murein DD-endopeptidase MepM/ murein hydrolase activator NlpD
MARARACQLVRPVFILVAATSWLPITQPTQPLLRPVPGPVIRPFASPLGPYGPGHRGVDLAAAPGTPVQASASGRVTFAGPVAGGVFVSVQHTGKLATRYSWLAATVVRPGQVVAAGEVIGLSGSGHPGTGMAHLHFAVVVDGRYVDPALYWVGKKVRLVA